MGGKVGWSYRALIGAVTPETHNPEQSPMISEGLASPVHQHLFCFRLDWALDGGPNSLYENEVEALPPGADNPPQHL